MIILVMYLCTLRAVAELTTTSPGGLRWFYKGIQFPWVLPEDQLGCFQSYCRDTHYDWENYFNQLMDAGVKNFVLGGNYIVDSEIRMGPPFFPPWSETGFAALRKRVDAEGGKIYADLDLYDDVVFDKALFVKSINNFTKHFPVHGFLLSYPDYKGNYTVKEALETIKELNFGCGFG
ncbi:hypothetical protein FOZ63_029340 [Perkinsus olseni]|uniref:Uncharacterized protein n=1 Tax=Perkinsus olseni TaxID=32597 RepID=A0A7J6QMH9_PEROL|nr:hypothetical protein FOZ62_002188 [Perkinsus olseni]KAF4746427.1 hypothetical protein FOZ63_029340 [Perkinsus olseni]